MAHHGRAHPIPVMAVRGPTPAPPPATQFVKLVGRGGLASVGGVLVGPGGLVASLLIFVMGIVNVLRRD